MRFSEVLPATGTMQTFAANCCDQILPAAKEWGVRTVTYIKDLLISSPNAVYTGATLGLFYLSAKTSSYGSAAIHFLSFKKINGMMPFHIWNFSVCALGSYALYNLLSPNPILAVALPTILFAILGPISQQGYNEHFTKMKKICWADLQACDAVTKVQILAEADLPASINKEVFLSISVKKFIAFKSAFSKVMNQNMHSLIESLKGDIKALGVSEEDSEQKKELLKKLGFEELPNLSKSPYHILTKIKKAVDELKTPPDNDFD